jgi:hypothetical protein
VHIGRGLALGLVLTGAREDLPGIRYEGKRQDEDGKHSAEYVGSVDDDDQHVE